MPENDPRVTRAERLQTLSRQRRENQKKELRQMILDAAGELFLEHGYAGFSLRQVAEEIGYSPGTIYLYFDNKDDLLFNMADEGFQRFREQQNEAAASTNDPAERLRAMARAYVRFGLENPAYYRLMFMERPDLLFTARRAEANRWLEALKDFQAMFEGAVQADVLRQGATESMSDAWWAQLHGIVALANSMGFLYDEERIQRALEAALTMLFDGFGRKA